MTIIDRLLVHFRALKSVFHDTVAHIREVHLLMVASSLAYTTILSLIPALAVSFAVFQAFGGLEKIYQGIEPWILENMAEGVSDEAIEYIRRFVTNAHAGAIGAGGFIGLVFTTMSMFNSIEGAINRIWKTRVSRSWFSRITSYWFFLTLGPLGLAVGIGVATSAQVPVSHILPGWTAVFLLIVVIFFIVYKFIPSRPVDWRAALAGACFSAVAWHLARAGYSLYTRKVVTYNKIYGSLGAIPIVLLWVYIVWLVVLTGAALSAALQKRIETP